MNTEIAYSGNCDNCDREVSRTWVFGNTFNRDGRDERWVSCSKCDSICLCESEVT